MIARLYRLIGPLVGRHALLLTFRGPDGRRREKLLEVISWDLRRKEAVVIALRGRDATWLRAALEGAAERIEIGSERLVPVARVLDGEEAVRLFGEYERRYRYLQPLTRPIVSGLAGFNYDGSPPARRRLLERMPLVAFGPAPVAATLR